MHARERQRLLAKLEATQERTVIACAGARTHWPVCLTLLRSGKMWNATKTRASPLLIVAAAWIWWPPFRRMTAYVYLHYIKFWTQLSSRRTAREYTKDDSLAEAAGGRSTPPELKGLISHVRSAEAEPYKAATARKFMSQKTARNFMHRRSVADLGNEMQSKEAALTSWLEEHVGHSSLFGRVPLRAARGAIFDTSADALLVASAKELAAGISVIFLDDDGRAEQGIDSGGLTKEWFMLLCAQLEEASLRHTTGGGRSMMKRSSVRGAFSPMFTALPDQSLFLAKSERPLAHFVALGRVLGMAVTLNARGESALISMPLSSALLKCIVGQPILAKDVRALDPTYFKNRIELLLEDGGLDLMCAALCLDEGDMRFCAYDDEGEPSEELRPGGAEEKVTAQSVEEYVACLSEHYLLGGVRGEMSSLLAGFYDVLPLDGLKACGITHTDLGLLLSGVQTVSVGDWKASANAAAASRTHPELVEWFWQILESVDDEARCRVLQFSTGMSRLPAGGFRALEPRFELKVQISASIDHLPSAHTCFNTLELPPYTSRASLDAKLMMAVVEGTGGFALL